MLVYLIKVSNGKSYVGVTRDVELRITAHLKADSYIGRAMRKHGFDHSVLYSGDKKACLQAEVQFIAQLGTKYPHGYNLTDGGEGVVGETDEVREARSKAMTRIMKDPRRRKQSAENGRNQVWDEKRRTAQAERAREQMKNPVRIKTNSQAMSKRLKAMWSDPEYRKLKSDQAKAQWASRRASDAG